MTERAHRRVARCGCGRDYNAATWGELDFVGFQDAGGGAVLEQRNCSCGSTLSRQRSIGLILTAMQRRIQALEE